MFERKMFLSKFGLVGKEEEVKFRLLQERVLPWKKSPGSRGQQALKQQEFPPAWTSTASAKKTLQNTEEGTTSDSDANGESNKRRDSFLFLCVSSTYCV